MSLLVCMLSRVLTQHENDSMGKVHACTLACTAHIARNPGPGGEGTSSDSALMAHLVCNGCQLQLMYPRTADSGVIDMHLDVCVLASKLLNFIVGEKLDSKRET